MAAIQLTCDIDGCGTKWSVPSAKHMKKSMDDHRHKYHPGWVPPEPKLGTPYRLDYSGRGRQF
jgi:hypothetical protein